MFIEQLSVKGFGKLTGLSVKLEKGLNIIYGSNESGKTTLQWFIKGMLYGLKGGRTSRDGTAAPLKTYKPWNWDSYGGSLEYRLDNGDSFRIDRDFERSTVSVFDASFNNITGSFDLSRDKSLLAAEKHLGLTEACFDRTVLVRQLETRIDESGNEELISRLVNVSQTGQEDLSFKKASEVLREAIKKNIGTEKTTTQPIDRLMAKLVQLGERRDKLKKKSDFRTAASNELKQLKTEEISLKKRKEYLDKIKDLIDVRRQLDEENDRSARLSDLGKRL